MMWKPYISWAKKKTRHWRVHYNVGSHLRRKLCAVKPTILGERHQVLSICLSRFSNTESILLTSNFTPLCGTLVNFFDSYNLILSEYFLLTSPWIVLVICAWVGMPVTWLWMVILDHDVYKVDNDSSIAILLRRSLKRKEFRHFSLINGIFSFSL